MPSERFYRLPAEKKRVIREAAVKEFARVPFEKASINQIIQSADISRGSFYTYFEDKQDVIRWLFEDNARQISSVCDQELLESNGDYFQMLERMFDYLIHALEDGKELLEVARNVFSNEENAKFLGFALNQGPSDYTKPDSVASQLFARVNKDMLKVQTVEEFYPLLSLSGAAMFMALRHYYQYPQELERVHAMFDQSLELLRHGSIAANAQTY
jgi:AcrR family transcriptional regulator